MQKLTVTQTAQLFNLLYDMFLVAVAHNAVSLDKAINTFKYNSTTFKRMSHTQAYNAVMLHDTVLRDSINSKLQAQLPQVYLQIHTPYPA